MGTISSDEACDHANANAHALLGAAPRRALGALRGGAAACGTALGVRFVHDALLHQHQEALPLGLLLLAFLEPRMPELDSRFYMYYTRRRRLTASPPPLVVGGSINNLETDKDDCGRQHAMIMGGGGCCDDDVHDDDSEK